ncbi:MAG: ROK family protein [Verrucomicrobiota bacterium JB024]|nr:ROK family protein [Verrucomicrobiota bacterium JB024]
MPHATPVYLGIDCGATTSKIGGVDARGAIISTTLRQRPTRGEDGPVAIIEGWMEGADAFLRDEGLSWDDVGGVGLAIPGPYQDYGILGPQPNLPRSLDGWHFLDDLTASVAKAARREITVVTANDGQLAGLGEAKRVQAITPGGVLMLVPGSGLGCSYVHADGTLLEGDHRAAAILCHMPAPHVKLGLPPFQCGCGRDWGCFEAYTSLSGLPQLLSHFLPQFPNHSLASPASPAKEKALALRELAQQGDPLALAIFDLQARAMGAAVATGCMAYDPTHIVIGGGLIDPEATTPAFRQRYLEGIKHSTAEYVWVEIDKLHFHEASLGELSQATGAALLALGR